MACSGTHCSEHGTGTETCSNHRGTCSTNRSVSWFPLSGGSAVGQTITDDKINELRTAIRDEITRYNLHADHAHTLREGTAYSTSTNINNDHINNMEQMVYDGENRKERVGSSYGVVTGATTWGNKTKESYSDGTTIQSAQWYRLKTRYDSLRTDCICNSDCSCNLVCSCHNDCGCNYSDIRLKENIKPLYSKKGLNVYSYNYIWDKTPQVGVMAHEVLETKYKDAVVTDKNGYYMVDYSKLPI